jgi:hypothetical protein
MPSSTITRLAVTAVAMSSLALAGACAPMKPPLQNAGPAISRTGVALAVVRQSCAQAKEPDFEDWDLVEERVELALENRSSEAVTIHRDRFRLIGPDGTALRPLTWLAGEPITVARGSTGLVQLRFMAPGVHEGDAHRRRRWGHAGRTSGLVRSGLVRAGARALAALPLASRKADSHAPRRFKR